LSWGFCIRSSVNCELIEATILQLSRRLPHSIFFNGPYFDRDRSRGFQKFRLKAAAAAELTARCRATENLANSQRFTLFRGLMGHQRARNSAQICRRRTTN
jgi:hypothetical protein